MPKLRLSNFRLIAALALAAPLLSALPAQADPVPGAPRPADIRHDRHDIRVDHHRMVRARRHHHWARAHRLQRDIAHDRHDIRHDRHEAH